MNFIDGHAGTLVFNIDAVYGNNVLLHKDTPYIIKLADQQNFREVDESLKTELDKKIIMSQLPQVKLILSTLFRAWTTA